MKKSVIIILSFVAFMGGFLILNNPKTVSTPAQNNPDISDTPQKWESKID